MMQELQMGNGSVTQVIPMHPARVSSHAGDVAK
jgi:hypothetical protein